VALAAPLLLRLLLLDLLLVRFEVLVCFLELLDLVDDDLLAVDSDVVATGVEDGVVPALVFDLLRLLDLRRLLLALRLVLVLVLLLLLLRTLLRTLDMPLAERKDLN
jgi:hypothetical protein